MPHMARKCVSTSILVVLVGGATPALAGSPIRASSAASCSHVRGYYRVKVKNLACPRAAQVLWAARQRGGNHIDVQGFSCRAVGHGAGGGFPVKMTCRASSAVASGWVIDGPA
jgi:hypothetical protein